MYDFHSDKGQYVAIQLQNAEKYVLPYIEESLSLGPGVQVLEIGSGKGSLLKAFVNRGCQATGVEMNPDFVEYARSWLGKDEASGKIRFVLKNIYEVDLAKELGGPFDLIAMKDVIEHIHDQAKLIGFLKGLLKPGGMVFFGFPPWYMPFGGHQQICRKKWLSRLPYYHLLPAFMYRFLLKSFREPMIDGLMEIKETGISIERFEKIIRNQGYRVLSTRHFMVNPVYEFKFGWKPRQQFQWIKAIPYVRDFFTTGVYYLVQPNKIQP